MSVQFPDEDDDMYSYFNKSVSAVQAHADNFEQKYARPALRTSQTFFEERPIAATFVAIFIFLSFIPTAFFLGLSLFAIISFSTLALVVVVFVSATVVLTFLSLLVLTLLITFISAAFLTLFGVSLYSFVSLLGFIRTHGSLGVSKWISYMSDFFIGNLSFESGSPILNGHDTEWSELDSTQHEVEPKHEDLDPPFSGSTQEASYGGDEKDLPG